MIPAESVCQLVGDIIECFEDFLDERGIDIPNPDKEQSEGGAATIYGLDYGELQSMVEGELARWKIIPSEYGGN